MTDIEVLDPSMSREEFLAQAAALEAGSEHPLAQAVVEKARGDGVSQAKAEDFQPGQGGAYQPLSPERHGWPATWLS